MYAAKLNAWLEAYGRAWEAKDSLSFVRLFSPAVSYHWTPFDEPKEGREAVAVAFEAATERQDQIAFRSSVLGQHAGQSLAHWQCSFVRIGTGATVHLDGIFLMEFNSQGECTVFREWWHSDETLASSSAAADDLRPGIQTAAAGEQLLEQP